MRYLACVGVFLAGLMAHWLWSTYFTVFGLAPQVLLVLTIAVASRGGPVAGQCFGFAWGVFLDVLGLHVFGAHALGLTLVGYAVGNLRRQMDVNFAAPQLVLVAVLTPAYFLFHALTGLVFEHHFLWPGWKSFLAGPVYNCLLAPLGFDFVRRTVDL